MINLNSRSLKILWKITFFIVPILFAISPLSLLQAQNATPNVDINSSGFKLIICDGPENLKYVDPATGIYDTTHKYVNNKFTPCNFRGAMMQINFLITLAVIVGVLVAIIGFTYAGFLYIKGGKGIDEAHKIFPKVFWGFIIMLSAWFIVYQILNWLTGSNTFSVLLGNP